MAKDKAIIWDANKIKRSREDAGFTLGDAADLLDITSEYLYMLEVGTRQPSPRMLIRLSKLYRQPHAHFLVDQKNFAIA